MAFLIIPAIAGVSVAITRLSGGKRAIALGITLIVLITCIAFGKPRPPRMDRADQSRERMAAAVSFIQANVRPQDLIFTDYQTDVILGHYLCRTNPIAFEAAEPGFEQFSCAGHRIVSLDYKGWMFWANNFPQEWQRFIEEYKPTPGEAVWIVQAGWGIGLPEDLRAHYEQFHDLQFESLGNNIKIFKMTVGQPAP